MIFVLSVSRTHVYIILYNVIKLVVQLFILLEYTTFQQMELIYSGDVNLFGFHQGSVLETFELNLEGHHLIV